MSGRSLGRASRAGALREQVGASFGAERELRFKHLQSEAEFGFPQRNGDIFAFSDVVNSVFQHCIPKQRMPRGDTARISIIWWGHAQPLREVLDGGFALPR